MVPEFISPSTDSALLERLYGGCAGGGKSHVKKLLKIADIAINQDSWEPKAPEETRELVSGGSPGLAASGLVVF